MILVMWSVVNVESARMCPFSSGKLIDQTQEKHASYAEVEHQRPRSN